MVGDATPQGPHGYHAIYSGPFPGQGHYGDTTILVRNDVNFSCHRINTPLQAITVKVFLHRQYTLCNVYISPSIPVERGDLDHLVNIL